MPTVWRRRKRISTAMASPMPLIASAHLALPVLLELAALPVLPVLLAQWVLSALLVPVDWETSKLSLEPALPTINR